jgi:hypothetical protein
MSGIFIALILFFPVVFLYSFSNKMKPGLDPNKGNILIESFANLKYYFVSLGVVVILFVLVWLIILLSDLH